MRRPALLASVLLTSCLWISAEEHAIRTDLDKDGVPAAQDCDDSRADVFPGAEEQPCDGVDNDCEASSFDGPVWLGRRPGAEGSAVVATFSTVTDALKLAEVGATIGLCRGTFREHVRIDKDQIVLAGEGSPELTVLDGEGAAGPVIEVAAKDVVIRQLTVTGGRGTMRDGYTYGGGVQALDAGGALSLMAVNISGNQADRGGGVAGPAGGLLTVGEGSLVELNLAQEGGGIYLVGDATVEASQVRSNTATSGGGIFLVRGALSLPGTELSLNEATRGGGLWAGVSDIGLPGSVLGGLLRANSAAEEGGGLWLDQGTVTETQIQDNVVTNGAGGGIFGQGVLSGVVVAGNEAPAGGGAAAVGELQVWGTRFENNRALQGDGGGLLVLPGASAWLDEEDGVPTSLVANTALWAGGNVAVSDGTLLVSHSEISQGEAGTGGGIAALGATCSVCQLTVTDSDVTDNVSRDAGGGLWTEVSTSLVESVLQGNLAGSLGGGMYASSSVIGDLVEARDNQAGAGGFAFLTEQAELDLLYAQIEANSAVDDGAAIFSTGTVRLVDGQVSTSSCPEGGALAIEGQGELDLERVQFTTNLDFDITRDGLPCTFDPTEQVTGLCTVASCGVCD
jgi:hypothetical protein